MCGFTGSFPMYLYWYQRLTARICKLNRQEIIRLASLMKLAMLIRLAWLEKLALLITFASRRFDKRFYLVNVIPLFCILKKTVHFLFNKVFWTTLLDPGVLICTTHDLFTMTVGRKHFIYLFLILVYVSDLLLIVFWNEGLVDRCFVEYTVLVKWLHFVCGNLIKGIWMLTNWTEIVRFFFFVLFFLDNRSQKITSSLF